MYQLSSISSVSSSERTLRRKMAWQVRRFLPWLEPSLTQFEPALGPSIYLSVYLSVYLFSIYYLFIYIYLYINLYLHINLSRDLVIFPIRLKNPRAHHPIVHQPSITTRKFKMWDYLVPLSFVWITWKARASWIKLSVVKLPFSERCFTIARCKVSSST